MPNYISDEAKKRARKAFGVGGADYAQNDPSGEGYIENRPFYDTRRIVKEETIFERTGIEGGRSFDEIVSAPLIAGRTYVVECSGSTYTCVAKVSHSDPDSYTAVYIGNLSRSNEWGDIDTGEPFFFATVEYHNNGEIWLNYVCGYGDETHSLKVTYREVDGELHTEPKYIPNSVWMEKEEITPILENCELHETSDDFQLPYHTFPYPGFKPGEILSVTLSNDGVDPDVTLELVVDNKGGADYMKTHGVLIDTSVDESTGLSYLVAMTYGHRKMSISLINREIKTNCDLMIEARGVEDSIECQLISGDYATAKAKIMKGLPVSAYAYGTLSWTDGDYVRKETFAEVCPVMAMEHGDSEVLSISGDRVWLVVLPDNTVELD